MDWQQPLALIIVASAAALLVWGRVRRRKFQFGCKSGCGCSSSAAGGNKSEMIYHARKGEQPRVFVKLR
jgi:hypothetical protein